MRRSLVVIVVVAAVWSASEPGLAQAPAQQQVLPPEARYWLGATTGAGMMTMGGMGGGMASMGSLMRMATSGGPPTEGRTIELKLGSTLSASGEPEAFHTMPPGAQVNQPISLETPPGAAPSAPSGYTVPKGRISFYWGCGEKAGPGQPVVLTFDKLLRGENDPALEGLEDAVAARAVRKPAPGNSKTYGDWPNADRRNRNRGLDASFPVGSTVAGRHVIKGNYSPEIDFTLPADKTFMEAVRYTATRVLPSGAISLSWNAPPRATGYSLGVMAPERANDDTSNIIMWSSAARPATFILMEYLTPAEVRRLIGLEAVLPAATTSCTVPAEVVKATKDGSMLMFTAFGDEATFIYPERPADPTVTWDQDWFARVGFKSARMDLISPKGVMDPFGGVAAGAAGDPAASAMSDEEYCKQLEAQQAGKPSVADAIPGGRLLGRLGGRRQQEQPPPDPRCANLKK